jgi:hypothetical protein
MTLFNTKITNYTFSPQPAICFTRHSTIPTPRKLENCEDNDFVIPTLKLFYFLDNKNKIMRKQCSEGITRQSRIDSSPLENAARSFYGCTQAECIFMYKPQATVYVSFFWSEISEMNMWGTK